MLWVLVAWVSKGKNSFNTFVLASQSNDPLRRSYSIHDAWCKLHNVRRINRTRLFSSHCTGSNKPLAVYYVWPFVPAVLSGSELY